MTRDEAERELKRRSELRPELSWLIVGSELAGWKVASLEMESGQGVSREETVETRDGSPEVADDPRTVHDQTLGPWVGFG